MTTFPPSPAQGETAGVSEQRIQRLIDDLQSQVDDFVRNGETYTGARYRDTAAALRELLAARQQLAEMRGLTYERVERFGYRMYGFGENKNTVSAQCECQQLRIELGWTGPGAALAPTSQPSGGKCETCDGTGFVPCIVGTHTTAAGVGEKECERCGGTGKVQDVVDSVDPEWSQGVEYPCPDCAQPERQGVDNWDCRQCGGDGGDSERVCPGCGGCGLAPIERKRPSPPQDDILAGLREILAGKNIAINPSIIERAIAALGEKGASSAEMNMRMYIENVENILRRCQHSGDWLEASTYIQLRDVPKPSPPIVRGA